MFRLSLFGRPSRPAPARRARLALETLGERWMPDNNDYIPIPDNPPEIVNFTAVEIGHGQFTFTGQVVDETPAGLTVTFGGAPTTTYGMTITTGANGYFSLTQQMRTDGADSGTITVQTKDPAGHPSNVASQDIRPTP